MTAAAGCDEIKRVKNIKTISSEPSATLALSVVRAPHPQDLFVPDEYDDLYFKV